jgi:hypothetical protein
VLAGGQEVAISRKIQGRPCAARPIISASAPVACQHRARLACGESMSPLATTGTRTAAFTAAMVSYSAWPLVALLARAAVHGEHRHAGASAARASAPRCARCWHQPVRIFSVTGTPCGAQAATTASTIGQRQRLVLHQRRAGPRCRPSWPGSPC